MTITFDGINRQIILPSGITSLMVQYIYARWKDWVTIGSNAKYLPAFRTVGGDPTIGVNYISTYYFLMNGWKIKPPEENCTIQLNGILLVDGGGDPFVSTVGNFNVRINMFTPMQAESVVIETGVSGLTAEESSRLLDIPTNPVLTTDVRLYTKEDIIAAVLAALNTTTIPVDLRKVKGQTIAGNGIATDPWRPT